MTQIGQMQAFVAQKLAIVPPLGYCKRTYVLTCGSTMWGQIMKAWKIMLNKLQAKPPCLAKSIKNVRLWWGDIFLRCREPKNYKARLKVINNLWKEKNN